jgi:hypothetical protein
MCLSVASVQTLPGQSDATESLFQPLTCGSHYVSGCQFGTPSQETNGFPLLTNSRFAVADEHKTIAKKTVLQVYNTEIHY